MTNTLSPDWDYLDALVGEQVYVETAYGEGELATVLAVNRRIDSIKVRAKDDGTVLIGNQWDLA